MVRLIDADAIKYHEYLEPMGNGMYVHGGIVDDKEIDAMPTIDAVPIGWIEERIRELYDASKEYDGCYDCAWALSEMVKKWREDHEVD